MNNTVQNIITGIATITIVGSSAIPVSAIVIDSRSVVPQCCFVAIKGIIVDGHSYIERAIAAGATSIVCEQLPSTIVANVSYIQVKDSAQVVGLLAAQFYNNPSNFMQVIGVTGTNGKTTVATLLYQLYTKLGFNCGLVSTVCNYVGATAVPTTHTTPDAVSLQQLLAQMYAAGCAYVFMEVSSHAVHQHRIVGINFKGALFTNITHDHLDYHGTFDNYIKAKKKFFDDLPATAFAITNLDDKNGPVMLQNTKAKTYNYGIKNIAYFKTKVLENLIDGLVLDLAGTEIHCRMIGGFNAYNLTLVFATAITLGTNKDEVLAILSTLNGAPGRFDTLRSVNQKVLGIVDYAHTPDALLNVLVTIQKLKTDAQQVITLVGCGGDRDTTKRPVMAKVACEYSNKVILTSDNPRTEDTTEILNQMEVGVPADKKKNVLRITDRKEAIKTAVQLANAGDIILVAGKGHENYQEINGVKQPFDDKEILNQIFTEQEK